MITFGYKSRVNGPLRAVIALAIGVMMVVYPGSALDLVVKIIAAFMVASGFISLIAGLRNKNGNLRQLMSFNAVVDVILGVLLFLFSGFVSKFIISLIGFALLIFGIIQLMALISARRVMNMSAGVYVMPAIVTLIGGFLLFNPFEAENIMVIVAGAALIVYGASELFSSWKMKKAMDEYEIHQAEPRDGGQATEADSFMDEAKEVDYRKVDEQ